VQDPVLILNGLGLKEQLDNPVNNVCFPSVITSSYAPVGSNLCSVTVLKNTLDLYKDRDADLDLAVRKQLSTWFPEYQNDIVNEWTLLNIYKIPKAQPSQLNGPSPANVHQIGRSDRFFGMNLPNGLYVCGDHTATATLNGALESGYAAGQAASSFLKAN
jgi:Flavin containing amine oxidoreductase